MLIDESPVPVPVAVPFDMIEQSEPKLLNEVMLMPCSASGVRAMMQPSEDGALVVVVCPATALAFMSKLAFDRPIQFSSTAPRLNLELLVTSTWTDPGVLPKPVGVVLTVTVTPLLPLVKPLRCTS